VEHFNLANPENGQARKSRARRPPSADLMVFRQRVLQLIEEAGSEVALERRAGLPLGSISHYSRRNPNEPLRPALIAIAKAMHVQLDWLCMGNGPKHRPEELDYIPSCGIDDR
jgi:hypothetical protein